MPDTLSTRYRATVEARKRLHELRVRQAVGEAVTEDELAEARAALAAAEEALSQARRAEAAYP
jgi:hypothetical protein